MRHWLVAALALMLLAGCRSEPAPRAFDSLYLNESLGEVGPFTLTDQRGRTVTREDLLGKVWVAQFFFTCCEQGCAVTTANMAELYRGLQGREGIALVSFSVYPEHDTPTVLGEYGSGWGADPERWLFLTGDEKVLFDLSVKSFKQGVERNKGTGRGDAVGHSFRLLVVDQQGKIRGYVNGKDRSEVERLQQRVIELTEEQEQREVAKHFPTVNAALNGTCAVLLVAGWVAIRRRWVLAHKMLMLAALAVAAAFLASYLYYHFVVLDGRPTRFTGEGWVRPVYLGVLLSHTVLAAAVAPLALVTAYLGLRDRLAGHTRLARWTLPLWLYVSVTGVAVYWMLYHLYPPG